MVNKYWLGKKRNEETKLKISKTKKGQPSPNKGKTFSKTHRENLSKSHLNNQVGERNGMWKGDKVGYSALHDWIKRNKPKLTHCEKCNNKKPLQAANISGEYKRDINDFMWLCARCHVYYDGTINNILNNRCIR